MAKWITNKVLMTQYGVGKNHANVVLNQANPHWIRKVPIPFTKQTQLEINITFLTRAEQFRIDIDNEVVELYYEMREHFGSDFALALWIDNKKQTAWNDFLRHVVFKPRPEKFTILSPKVAKRKVTFVRRARRYLSKHGRLI